MNYNPSPKVAAVLEAMRAAPDQVWTSEAIAPILEVPRAQVPSYLDAAVRHGVVHRQVADNGRLRYGLQPFPAKQAPIEVPRFVPFVPQMIAPRPGSDVPAPSPTAAPAPAPTAAPEVAKPMAKVEESPQAAAAPSVEPVAEIDEELEEVQEFDFCRWKDGAVQVWGAQAMDDGSVRISAEQLREIQRAAA